jgi:hypothetical protein
MMRVMTTAAAIAAPGLTVVPDSLGDLDGPAEGKITLPVTTCWYQRDRTFDVGDLDDCLDAYEAVLGDGTLGDATRFLNPGRLTEVWPLLRFDARRRAAWERRHPELRRHLAAA